MSGDFQTLRSKLNERKAARDVILGTVQYNKQQLKEIGAAVDTYLQARTVIQTVGERTQQNLEHELESIGQLALNSILDDPPVFKVKFVQRRNQTECDITLDGQAPLDGDAGGALDIISFALRISFWCINKSRHVFILDEPFRNLSPDLHNKAGELLKQLSKELGLQFIIISHSVDINENADRVFSVRKTNGVSLVTKL